MGSRFIPLISNNALQWDASVAAKSSGSFGAPERGVSQID